jgi:hypothetical protein
MSKKEKSLVGFLTGAAQNPVANVVAILILVLIGGLYTLYSNGPQTGLLWVLIVLVTLNSFVSLRLLRSHTAASERPSESALVRDAQSGMLYLMDANGKAREIPDKKTSLFLEYALGIVGEIPEASPIEIARLRGERLASIEKWEPPLTPEERRQKELRLTVSRMLTTESHFDETSRPQKIDVQISNHGSEPVHVNRLTFQHHDLPDSALYPTYLKDGSYTVIPFNKDASNIDSGGHLEIELQLSQVWQRSDIERTKGRWGFLILDVVYEGEPVKGILYQL